MSQSVFLTGATGFVGGATLAQLVAADYKVSISLRGDPELPGAGLTKFYIQNFNGSTDWAGCLDNVSVVIHAAARVHVMNDTEADPLAAFRTVNVDGTLNLARHAAKSGVKRFIFISSIKVNGEATSPSAAFSPEDVPNPADPYGISKMEAEQGLRKLAAETGMEVVIIRPVLVYGPGVKANFKNMMRWLDKGIPLPFGAIHNSRSLVALDNLVDLILTCINHPSAANQTFLVSDGDDQSTTQLLKGMGRALERPARLIPVPAWALTFVLTLLGRKDLSNRLCGSLKVDISKTKSLLGWVPPVSVDEALKRTAYKFRESK